MKLENNFNKNFAQQNIADIVQRLKNIAYQMDIYNQTNSYERAINTLLDEIRVLSNDLMSVDNLEIYNQKMDDYVLFVQQKWQQFYEHYGVEELDYYLQLQQNVQDDTKIHEINAPKFENRLERLEDNGIIMSEVNQTDILTIKSMLGPYANQYHDAWTVENTKTHAKFSQFIENTGEIDTRLLWHGSGNENWWGIIRAGLMIQPKDAIIAGRMFGDGIYFATNAEKSVYFTSIKAPNKRKRVSNTCFMGIYDVACGVAYDVYTYDPKFSHFDYNELQKVKKGAHCLYAHEGEVLKNEEIVIYQEEQTTIKYLVELRGMTEIM